MGITQVPNTGSRKNIYPKYEIQQGPWTGGLNLAADASLIGTNELQECINFMVKPGGSLYTRPSVSRSFANLPVPDYRNYVSALGSIINTSNQSTPIISVCNPTTGNTTFWRYKGPVTGWIPAFATISNVSDVPRQVIYYNTKYFLFYNIVGCFVTSSITGTPSPVTGSNGFGGSKVVMLKDRFLILSNAFASVGDIYWSDINPNGTSTDWSSSPPHTFGSLGLSREDSGEGIRDICVHDDSLYICTYRRVYRLSWTSNPGVAGDGELTLISDTIGGSAMETYNGNLYLLNGDGLYRLVSNYFVEVSQAVRPFLRAASKGVSANVNSFASVTDPVLGLYLLGSKLLCGPFNAGAPLRYNDVTDYATGNMYLVYDMDLNIWYKWQYSANLVDPIAGPSQSILYSSVDDASSTEKYLWIGVTLNNGVLTSGFRSQSVYSMEAADLVNFTMGSGQDIATGRKQWIGGKFSTSSVDLGDNSSWKKLLTSLLDANYAAQSHFTHDASEIGYSIDGHDVNLTPVDNSRLKFGGAYRFRSYSFHYDSITGCEFNPVFGGTTSPILNDINRFSSYVTTSRKNVA